MGHRRHRSSRRDPEIMRWSRHPPLVGGSPHQYGTGDVLSLRLRRGWPARGGCQLPPRMDYGLGVFARSAISSLTSSSQIVSMVSGSLLWVRSVICLDRFFLYTSIALKNLLEANHRDDPGLMVSGPPALLRR